MLGEILSFERIPGCQLGAFGAGTDFPVWSPFLVSGYSTCKVVSDSAEAGTS